MLHHPVRVGKTVALGADGVVSQREAHVQSDGEEEREEVEHSLRINTLPSSRVR